MAKYNLQSLELFFSRHPDNGEWVVVSHITDGKDHRKTFEKFEDAATHIWNLIHKHARTCKIEGISSDQVAS